MSAATAEKLPAPSSAPEPASSKKRDWLGVVLLVLIVVNLGAMAGIAHYMQRLAQQVSGIEDQVVLLSKQAESRKQTNLGQELQPKELGEFYPLDGFLVNLSSDQGARFLQTQIELELDNIAVADELSQNKAAIRDAVIVLLSSRSYRALREPDGLPALRKDILQALNAILKTGQVTQVYFTQFHFN